MPLGAKIFSEILSKAYLWAFNPCKMLSRICRFKLSSLWDGNSEIKREC